MYTHIDQPLVDSLHGLLNCEIGGLDCHVITTEFRTSVHYIHMSHLFCNALVYVIYFVVSGQYSYTIPISQFRRPCNEFKSVSSMFPCYNCQCSLPFIFIIYLFHIPIDSYIRPAYKWMAVLLQIYPSPFYAW